MKWTLVTGGGKGLGANVCRYLSNKGYRVIIQYNKSQEEAERLVSECQVEMIQGDFSTIESTFDFIERYKKKYSDTQNLINNVGNYLINPPLQTPITEWVKLFQTNLFTPIQLIQSLIETIKGNRGNIINIGVVGLSQTDIYSTAYTMTKRCLFNLTKSLAKEFASDHVNVNMVSPGHLENSVDLPKDLSKLPMGRTGTTEEVARVIEFLLDPSSEYITGQNIEVAGSLRL